MPPYSFNVETGRLESRKETHCEVVKEAGLPEKVSGNVPTEAGLYVDYVCSNNKLYIVEVDF
jgi:hypothetical protein